MMELATVLSEVVRKRSAVPEYGRIFVDAWNDLDATRQWHTSGAPIAISYAEISAYSELMNMPFEPHHVRIIRAMDQAYVANFKSGAAGAVERQASSELTPALFDAVFS